MSVVTAAATTAGSSSSGGELAWEQNKTIVESSPFERGQRVTYKVAVWLSRNCSTGSAAVDVVLTLSLLGHSELVTHQDECSVYHDTNFLECAVKRLKCGGTYTLKVRARLPTEGSFAPAIASVSSKSVAKGFRTVSASNSTRDP